VTNRLLSKCQYGEDPQHAFKNIKIVLLLSFFLTIYLSYLAYIYVMYLCYIFSKPFTTENKGPDVVRILQFRPPSCCPEYAIRKPSVTFWPMTFHQRLDRLLEFECIF